MPFPSKTSNAAIAEQALSIVREKGLDALSMRNLAGDLGIRAASLYRHFPDRQSLEAELGAQAAALLNKRMVKAAHGKKAAPRLRAAAKEYVQFARGEPALFQLLLLPGPSTGARKDLWNYLLDLVGGITGNPDDTAATVAVWSFLHGFVNLELSGLFGASGPHDALDKGLEALIRGLAQKGG